MKKIVKIISLGSITILLTIAVMITSASAYLMGPTTPGKWGSSVFGTGATVTWSLMPTGTTTSDATGNITALGDFMPTGWKPEIEAAFEAWSTVADITFIEVADGGEPFNSAGSSGDIRLGGHSFDGAGGTLAHGYYPPNNGLTAAGDIHFDIAEFWKTGFGGSGYNIFQVAAHEIGHSIGLGHENTSIIALMDPYYTEAFIGLQPDDIAGAQYIYGEATTPIPEPSTMILLFSGLAGFTALRKKKQ